MFVSPGQVFGYPADGSTYQAKGWCLYFSPELLRGTPLGRHIKDYTFFSYDVSEGPPPVASGARDHHRLSAQD